MLKVIENKASSGITDCGMTNVSRYCWLFGENLSRSANNNSFFFWQHIYKEAKADNIDAFFVLEKNKYNIKLRQSMDDDARKLIIWRNSIQHYRLFEKADMLFVTLSYLDVVPDQILHRKIQRYAQAPVVYLQHGILGMKKIGYNAHAYNNNMFRFLYYNRNIKDIFIEKNAFREHQLLYGEYMPRHKELFKRINVFNQSIRKNKVILWFLTWREYQEGSAEEKLFLRTIAHVLGSADLQDYLSSSGTTLRVVSHSLAEYKLLDELSIESLPAQIKFMDASKIDVMQEIVEANFLITDYSSIAYDFALLEKPMLLFQPDLDTYVQARELYCEIEHLREISLTRSLDLVKAIINSEFELLPFFREAWPDVIDKEYILQGRQIDRLYQHFKSVQYNTIAFLGYGFWGVGGTVTATRALAESLTEKGYAVKLLSLKRLSYKSPTNNPPAGICFSAFYTSSNTKQKVELLKRYAPLSKKQLDIFSNDSLKGNLIPYAGWAFKKYLRSCNEKVVVSTRESMHLPLLASNNSAKKICFFHTNAELLEDYFPGISKELAHRIIPHAMFTTDTNATALNEIGVKFNDRLVIGNTLESQNILTPEQIVDLRLDRYEKRKECDFISISCVSLMRFSEERVPDVKRIIEFGKYIYEHNLPISISIFGDGPALEALIDGIVINDLQQIILPKGRTQRPAETIREYDLVIDFASQQSFGMTYLEAVFNGVYPLCTNNVGSSEIFKDFEELFFNSWETLAEKIMLYSQKNTIDFLKLYEVIKQRYSHEVLATKFIKFSELEQIPFIRDPKSD